MRGLAYRRYKADLKACRRIDIMFNLSFYNKDVDELCKMTKHGYLGRYIKPYKNSYKNFRKHYKEIIKYQNKSNRSKIKMKLYQKVNYEDSE